MNVPDNSKTFFPKLILIGTGFFLIFSFYYITSSFYHSLELAEHSEVKRLETITKSLSIIIDGDRYDSMMKKYPNKDDIRENVQDPYYNDLHELLAYTKDINELPTDVYTWVVDTNSKGEFSVQFGVSSGETPYFRHNWESFPSEMIPVFYIGGSLEEYVDENGRWISFFHPIFNSKGQAVGAIQADISYDILVSEIKISGFKKGVVLLITVLFFIVILIWVLNRLHKKQRSLIETQVLEGKYRELIDSSLDFIFTIDIQRKITYLNDVFRSFFGEKDIVGESFIEILSKNQRAEGEQFIKELILHPKNVKKELLIQSPEGENLWIELIFVPNYKGSILEGFQITGRDVTENKKLKHRVDQERLKAVHSLKSKENFFANMSHEIRTPLNAIIGMESLISKTNLPNQEQEYLANIKLSAKGLLQIINDILDYSKVEAGKLTIEKIPFKIQSIVSTIERTFSFRFEEKGVDLQYNITPGIEETVIKSDLLRLNQIVINLVSNALKFTETGNVLINIQIDQSSSPVLKISVKDTGLGIPKNKKQNLFESFTQAKEDTSRKYGGTGLGLSICKKITELLGGNISFESTEGVGTEFRFQIPIELSSEKISDVEDEIEADISRLKNIRILVAEDNPINTVYISGLLDDLGLNHVTVENGEKAIKQLQKEDFDVVLMDIQMPIMDGMEATRYIRNELKSDIPIIALTANAFPEDRKKVFDNGMNGFVSKPFEQMDLVNELSRVCVGVSIDTIPLEKKDSSGTSTVYSLDKLIEISNGNESFVDKMVQIFIEEAPLNIELLEQLITEEAIVKLGQLAHKMKPSVDMFQMGELSVVVRDIENMSKEIAPNKKALFDKALFVIDQLNFVLKDLKLNRN